MISFRFARYVAIMLGVALIPTVIHSYLGLRATDGRSVKNINTEISGYISQPTKRNTNWGEITFDCFDWFERTYRDPKGNLVRLFVGRSYDHKRLYHHPELALSYGENFNLKQQISLPGSPEIPVKLLSNRTNPGIVAYTLLFENRFIDNPIGHQIKNSLSLLISPGKPITLFYVAQANINPSTPFIETPAALILQHAIDDFRKI